MKIFNDFVTFILRIALLYLVFGICRVFFYTFNSTLIGAVSWAELSLLLKGALVFDSASIFYLNFPFLILSLLPFKFRRYKGYQTVLLVVFVTINSVGLALNFADIFYYPFKLARLAADDIYLTTQDNFGRLMIQFMENYWYGFLVFGIVIYLLILIFKKLPYRASEAKTLIGYYLSQTVILGLSCLGGIFLIRGCTMDHATYPISVSDATMYASPQKSALILSNPFVFIRTFGQRDELHFVHYFSDDGQLERVFSPDHCGDSSRTASRPNIVLIILESFATPHIKALSTEFPADRPSYTPFLDSLINNSLSYTNAYHNSLRSLDALPALWGSIPSFKTQFLSLPQSSAPMKPLPALLGELGYTSAFMHGANRESMSFVAFGKNSGVSLFVSREEYESECGTANYDGNWGIFDHKFLPYLVDKTSKIPEPFFATIFTLSSHHPYTIPEGFEERFDKGTMPIHETIGYSDYAMRLFFETASTQNWYKNTIFIITADHGSGADSEKYRKVPFNHSIPLLFYKADGSLHGKCDEPASQIDVMPTVLHIVGYKEPYFAFGRDLLESDDTPPRHAIHYFGEAFNTVTDSLVYIFNERRVMSVFNYRTDPLQTTNLVTSESQKDSVALCTKAFIQSYFQHLNSMNFMCPTSLNLPVHKTLSTLSTRN